MNYKSKDGLSEAIERLRSELSGIKEELRVIELRKPALESRAQRISEALQTLMGDGSTGDPRWMQLPRVSERGLVSSEEAPAAGGYPDEYPRRRGPKPKVGPLKRPEISEEALIEMSYFIQSSNRPVKSSELYEHLVGEGKMEPIETEMPYKSFAITLRNIHQDFIEYDRATKTWNQKGPSPKDKLRAAMEKGDGTRVVSSHSLTSNREDHLFVKVLSTIFRDNRWEPLTAGRIYDELTDKREFGLIPGVGNFLEFASTLSSYTDFFDHDESTNTYSATRQDLAPKQESPVSAAGLYTVKSSNGNVTA
jgi:hypothetical protein